MLMTKERRPAIRTLRGWALHVLQEASAIHECEEHGWASVPTRMRASMRWISPGRSHRTAGLQIRRSPRFAKCWIRSAIPAQSVRRTSRVSVGDVPGYSSVLLRSPDILR